MKSIDYEKHPSPLRPQGKTLLNWREEVARMFHFTRNNCITEVFLRKIKLIQRRAYGLATLKITACGCAYCAAEMAGEMISNPSEKLPVEGA